MFNVTPKITNEVISSISDILNHGKRCSYSKNQYICRAGDEVEHLFYMTSGLVKCFQIIDEREVIFRLLTDDSVVLGYSGFITRTASSEYIQCLDECHGYRFSVQDLEAERSHNTQIDLLLRYMAEKHYLSMERRLIMLQQKSSEQKYRYFMKSMEPKIIDKTPMHCIASYLGITPESFSRMKKNLTI